MRVSETLLQATLAIGMAFASLQVKELSFPGTSWKQSRSEAAAALSLQGLMTSIDLEGDLLLAGEWHGFDVRGTALISRDTLARLSLTFVVDDEDALETYRTVVGILTSIHGHPAKDYDFLVDSSIVRPALEAIREGNRQLATFWSGSNVGVRLTEDLNVEVEYRGPRWALEMARRTGGNGHS